jgi:hypothetical protein
MVEAGKRPAARNWGLTSNYGNGKALAVAYDNLDQEEAYIVELKEQWTVKNDVSWLYIQWSTDNFIVQVDVLLPFSR